MEFYSEFQLIIQLSGPQLHCFGSLTALSMVMFSATACSCLKKKKKKMRKQLASEQSGAFKSQMFPLVVGRDQKQI